MIIDKVLNNNTIASHDENGKEIIVMGKGLGFMQKAGNRVDDKKIEKVFKLDHDEQLNQFETLLKTVSKSVLKVTFDIIDYARLTLGKDLATSIYISLPDHINFAIKRSKEGLLFQNPLLNDVQLFYASEFLVGEYALSQIKEKLGVKLIRDEAASIALHIVNAEYSVNMETTLKITTLISNAKNIIEKELNLELDEHSLDYSRFATHLKFMAQRIFKNSMLQDADLVQMVIERYSKEYEVSKKISEYIKETYEKDMSMGELGFLTIHIYRLSHSNDEG